MCIPRSAQTLPTHLPGLDDEPLPHLRSIPHAGDQERERLWEVEGRSGFQFMDGH